MSDHREEEEPGSLFEDWALDVFCNMQDPPSEAYETSWLRARDLLEAAGPTGAILLLTVTEDSEGDLASSVVLSSGYQEIPTRYILEILETHLEALREE